MAGQRRLQQRHRQHRSGRLPEPHVEIEQRAHPEAAQQQPVTGLGGYMRHPAMIERVAARRRQRRRRNRADEAIEQHWNATQPGADNGTGDGRQLTAAKPAQQIERIRRFRQMKAHTCCNHAPLRRQPVALNAGAGPRPGDGASAEKRMCQRRRGGGVADAHLTEA